MTEVDGANPERKRSEILAKVVKLLRLTKSSNEFEAALAAERAQALLDKYKLEIADVPGDHPEGIVERTFSWPARVFSTWAIRLLVLVSETTHCRPLYNSFHKTYTLIGKPADVAVTHELYVYLYGQVDRLRREFAPDASQRPSWERPATYTRLTRLSFALGCVSRLGERLQMTFVARQQAEPALRALIVVESRAITQYIAAKYPKLHTMRRSDDYSYATAFHAGRAAGETVRLTGFHKELR
jgi:hypothetical protein